MYKVFPSYSWLIFNCLKVNFQLIKYVPEFLLKNYLKSSISYIITLERNVLRLLTIVLITLTLRKGLRKCFHISPMTELLKYFKIVK